VRDIRIENWRNEHRLCAVQDVGDRGSEREGTRRRLDPFRMADEQRVLEQVPKPAQCVTCGRLGERQPLCGAADMALTEEHLEHDQQVQIGATKINLVHQPQSYYELDY